MDESTKSTVQLAFGPETLQDKDMQLLGIGINLDHQVVICMVCHSSVSPKGLYDHIRIPGHHERRDFQKNQRLAFVTWEFCNQLVDHHHLNIPPPRPPTTITPAIPGLTVCTDMMICSQCGYAACTKKAVHWHQITKGCT